MNAKRLTLVLVFQVFVQRRLLPSPDVSTKILDAYKDPGFCAVLYEP